MMNDLTIPGENGLDAMAQTQRFFIHLEIKRNTVKLLQKQKSIATELRELLPAQFVLNVFGMHWLTKSNTVFGAVCRTENETPLLENGRKNTKVN